MNPFPYSDSNKRYHTLDYYFRKKYHSKVFKVSLNAGFTCPNIDGKVGYGGCIYCSKSGSGDFAGNKEKPLEEQFNEGKEILHKKWKSAKYIGYFQAHTNTYAPLRELKEKYESILSLDNVVGINIATRADAIEDDVLDYLEKLNQNTDVTIELGLQTIHEKTSNLINRCHSLSCFVDMVRKLRKRNLPVVVHIINGLPYEDKKMMLETVSFLNKLDIQGIKIHMLHILKDTPLERIYQEKKFPLLSKADYVDIVCSQLEILRKEIVIHRITGDPKVEDLIEPHWLEKKFSVLNEIDKTLAKRNTYQGFQSSILNYVRRSIDEHVKEKDIVIDATVGQGKDTVYLSNKVKKGHVFGFDIQKEAIDMAGKKISLNNVTFFVKSHDTMIETLPEYKRKISLILFNLGYFPKGDKSITTKWDTTKKAILQSFSLLHPKGKLLIVVYPGHKEGKKESEEIIKFLTHSHYDYQIFRNTNNSLAPYLIEIENKDNSELVESK